jgi:hypothetical protein
MLGDLEHESVLDSLNFEGVENGGQGALELHVHDGTDDLRDLSMSDLSGESTCSGVRVSK